MHTVVNHIPLKPGTDWPALTATLEALMGLVTGHPEVISLQAVRAGDEELILLITFADEGSMAGFSSQVAGPWFAENVRPFMGGPADRKTGACVFAYP